MSNYDFTIEPTAYCPVCGFLLCKCKQPEPESKRYGGEDTVKRYRERPPEVKAVKWTGENIEEVREFADSNWIDATLELARNEPALIVNKQRAHVGHWLVRAPEGFVVLSDEKFHYRFELIEEGTMEGADGFSMHITNPSAMDVR